MKKRKIYFLYSKSIAIYLAILALIAMLVVNSGASIAAVKRALILCYQTVIPSLFPFFVLSGALINTGFVRAAGGALSPVIRPVFRVDGSGALAFVIGIVSGYPMGAKMVAELYEKKLISRTEGMRLLPYCNNSGPLFIIGAVGAGMLGNGRIGLLLYAVHLAAALCVGLCFRFYKSGADALPERERVRTAVGRQLREYYRDEARSLGEILTQCVSDAVRTTLLVCGFIALFSSFVECLKPLIDACIPARTLNLLIKGMFEVTMGVNGVAIEENIPITQKLAMISFLTGFGGICVHLQVLGMVSGSGLQLKTYLTGKALHALFAAVIAFAAVSLMPLETVLAWSQQEVAAAQAGSHPLWQAFAFGAFAAASAFLLYKRRTRKKRYLRRAAGEKQTHIA